MKHSIYLLAITSLLLASCNTPFKKAEGGLQYKIISDGKGKTLKNGDFIEIQINQSYKGPWKRYSPIRFENGFQPDNCYGFGWHPTCLL
jgi:hypothetical protein